ncbi:UDP-N-acetylmuramate--L-alanine ligase [bacterium]|nr:UDP-N-acetylmuramate--L-alanine ligase [bacterium]|tara:strand:- start:91 stop:1449 length:1359 start_codon:yes stop_codon:yes gene_type:complete
MKKIVKKRVHFVGIGGIGMSALARYYLAQNWAVSGSDLVSSPIIRDLAKVGIRAKIGHKMGNLPKNAHFIVFSGAVLRSNPEICAARRRGIPRKSYAEALGEITQEHETIAVTGAHGKSTTTSLLALSMIGAGLDPTVIVGTKLWEFGDSNFYFGKSSRLVIEADEYGGTFLHTSPTHAIVLNIDREHLDYYKSLARVKQAFLEFIANIRPHGVLAINKDDEIIWSLRRRILAISKRHDLILCWYSLRDSNAGRVRNVLRISGEHNVSNALAVYTFLRELGVRAKDILSPLSKFQGSWRRMEYKGKLKAISSKLNAEVYDDYAHHPTEIKATLQAFQEKFPKKKLVCVYQPHQAKRLRLLFQDFADAFVGADVTVLLPVYRVAGRDKVLPKYSSRALTEEIVNRHSKSRVVYLGSMKDFRKTIEEVISEIGSPTVLIMMGAGSIFEYTKKLL